MQDHMLNLGDGTRLAYRRHKAVSTGGRPTIVFCPGFRSVMSGIKGEFLAEMTAEEGLGYACFDYRGHGASSGRFEDGTIGAWLADLLAIIDDATSGPLILVGSSMGAWIALRMVRELNGSAGDDPIAGLLLLAPAPDFTSELHEPRLTEAQRRELDEKGYFEEPTPYGPEPNVFTRALFEDGRANRVMTGPIDTFCPVHIIQGQADPDVPWQHAQRLFALLSKDDATIGYVKDGDHRLSRPQDIALMLGAAGTLAARAGAA